jgi:hypothetical protein
MFIEISLTDKSVPLFAKYQPRLPPGVLRL